MSRINTSAKRDASRDATTYEHDTTPLVASARGDTTNNTNDTNERSVDPGRRNGQTLGADPAQGLSDTRTDYPRDLDPSALSQDDEIDYNLLGDLPEVYGFYSEATLDGSEEYNVNPTIVGRRVTMPPGSDGHVQTQSAEDGKEVNSSPRSLGVPSESTKSQACGEAYESDFSDRQTATSNDANDNRSSDHSTINYNDHVGRADARGGFEEGSEPITIIGRTSRGESRDAGRTHYKFSVLGRRLCGSNFTNRKV